MKTGQIVTHRGMETLYGLRMLFGTQVPVGWDKVRVGFKFVGGVVGTGDGMEPRKEPTSCGATSVSQLKNQWVALGVYQKPPRPSTCVFFRHEMPHLIEFHHVDLDRRLLSLERFNGLTQRPDPPHHADIAHLE